MSGVTMKEAFVELVSCLFFRLFPQFFLPLSDLYREVAVLVTKGVLEARRVEANLLGK